MLHCLILPFCIYLKNVEIDTVSCLSIGAVQFSFHSLNRTISCPKRGFRSILEFFDKEGAMCGFGWDDAEILSQDIFFAKIIVKCIHDI